MSTRDVDIAVTYQLRTVDRGVRQAVTLSQDLTRSTKATHRELDTALRASSAAWKDTARVAAGAQRQVTEATSRAQTQVNRSLLKQVEDLRKAGVGYKEISSAAKGWGVTAQETARVVKRAADEEIRQIDRVVAARNKLRGAVGLSTTRGAAGGHPGMGAEGRGVERGAVRAAAGRFRGGVSMIGGGLVGGLAAYVGVTGIKDAVENTKNLALQTRTLSAVTGMDAKTASGWIAITQARDIKTKTFAMTLKTLSTQTEGAIGGTKKSVTAFKALGITTDDLKKHSGDLSSLLGLVADHLDKMPGGAQKTAIASQLLGRNWTALQPLMLEGSKGMAAQRKEAAALGVTLGGNAAENAKKLEEASVSLKIAQEGLQVQFAEHVAPAMIKVTEGGIKLFGVLRKDLGPAVHFVTGEVKDATHWLGEHKTVLHGVEIALAGAAAGFVGLRVISGTVRLVRGIGNDFRAVGGAVKTIASPLSSLKGLFAGQETESQALMRSQNALAEANTRLAASFDEVAVASRGAAGGEALAGEAGGVAGGAPLLATRRAGAAAAAEEGALAGGKGVAAAEKLGAAAQTEIQQTGMWGMLLGRQGGQTLTSRLSGLGGGLMKGAGIGIGGLLASQLAGSAIGGKAGHTVGSIGTAASIGAGVGSIIGPEGTFAGAGIGAALAGLHALGGSNLSDSEAKLEKQMSDAAKSGNWKKLDQLGASADRMARSIGSNAALTRGGSLGGVVGKFASLGDQADKLSAAIRNQKAFKTAGRAVTGIETSIAGSKFAPSTRQIGSSTISQLRGLARPAQQAGADAIVRFTAGLESQKRLPVGSTNKLIAQLERYYGPSFASALGKYGDQSMAAIQNSIDRSKVVSKVQSQVDQMHKQWGLLVPDVTVTSSNVKQVMTGNIEAMRKQVLSTTGQERTDAINHLNALLALYQAYTPLIAKQGSLGFMQMSSQITGVLSAIGGTLGGTLGGWVTMIGNFTQAIAPELSSLAGAVNSGQFETAAGANAALGSAAVAIGKRALDILTPKKKGKRGGGYFDGMVPGDQTRDGTLAWLSGREFVMTGHGQSMMDSYAPGLLDHIAASQAPHFAGGGPVSFQGRVSTFGPPTEGAGATATGVSDSTAGISLRLPGTIYQDPRNEALKNRWFELQIGSHKDAAKDIDIGPNQSTGRNIDVTGAQAKKMGINPFAFPTDSIGRVVELIGGQHGHPASSKQSLQPNAKTTYKPSGPGLKDGFFEGYEFGSGAGGTGPAGALRAAILGSQLTAVTTKTPAAVKFSLPLSGKLPKSLQGDKYALNVAQGMFRAAGQIIGKPYGHDGGHGSWVAPDYDCSGAVGYVLRGGKLTDSFQWTGSLAGWGLPGPGKYVTVGLRDPQSENNGHTMINFFGKYLESGGGGPLGRPSVHWDQGWDGVFPISRHPPNLRRGGRIPAFRAGGAVAGARRRWPWRINRNEADSGRRIPRFRTGGGSLSFPPNTSGSSGGLSFGRAGANPSYLAPNMRYLPPVNVAQVNALQPVVHYDYGAGRESGATSRLVGRDVGAISAAGSNVAARRSLTAFSKVIGNARKMPYDALLGEAKTLEAEVVKATKAGDKQKATRLRQALQLVQNQEGTRVGKLVKTATDEAASIDDANKKLSNLMTRNQIDPASAQGTAMLEKFQDQSVKVIRDEVTKLQKAYELARKAGNKRAMGDIGSKLHDALGALDDATATAVQDHVDAVNAAKQKVADAAQARVDSATHDVTMAQTGEQSLDIQQQMSGTAGTSAGAQQLSDYINQNVVPAMQKQVASLQQQQYVAAAQGNTSLAAQIGEQVASAQQGIQQEQLTAQQATAAAAEATAQNTQDLVGNLGVSYNGSTFSNLAGALNGA